MKEIYKLRMQISMATRENVGILFYCRDVVIFIFSLCIFAKKKKMKGKKSHETEQNNKKSTFFIISFHFTFI